RILTVFLLLAGAVVFIRADASLDLYRGVSSSDKNIYLMTCLAPPPVHGSGLYATDRSLCWDAGDTIKVQFLDGSPEEADFVIKTASEWSKFANIRFAAAKTGGDVRVTFNTPGFASRVGRDALTAAENEPTVLLGFASSP